MLVRVFELLIYLYYMLLLKTMRFEIHDFEEPLREIKLGLSPVFALTHASTIVAMISWDGKPLTVLASRSKDGELAARLLEKRGCRVVRGSSSRGGKEAMGELRAALRAAEPVAITFDGPRGPALVPKPGVAALARESTGSLFFVSIRPRPTLFRGLYLCTRLGSWDRFFLPFPFARMAVTYEKVNMPPKESSPADAWIAQALSELEKRARSAYDV